eukprot:scaffold1289_cov188-Alexandrium_tamarense.AAC.10
MRAVSKPTLLLLLAILGTRAERIYFDDGEFHSTTQDYESHNLFILNGTTLSLVDNHSITAPPSSGDGEDAIRVEDANFSAYGGVITGGLGVGGAGVTVTTNRDSGFVSTATFEWPVQVNGGDAIRETTTKGGDAIQVLHEGSMAIIYGGTFTPGTGCSVKVCGEQTTDGNSLQILDGKAAVRGGQFNGNFYSLKGTIEVYGCVEFDGEQITGVLSDGTTIDVTYVGSESDLKLMYSNTTCPEPAKQAETEPSNAATSKSSLVAVALLSSLLKFML